MSLSAISNHPKPSPQMSQNIPKCPVSMDPLSNPILTDSPKSIVANDLSSASVPEPSPDSPQLGHPITSQPHTDLSEPQLQALDLLIQGHSDTRIAQSLTIDRRTLYRWRHQPAFAQALADQRHQLRQSAADRLHTLLPAAFNVLKTQLLAPYDRTAFRAAATILRFALPRPLHPNCNNNNPIIPNTKSDTRNP